MDTSSRRWTLRARLVIPVATPPLKDGFVTLAGDRIWAIGATSAEGTVYDLGNVALLPGLVNAHTHLEFSRLTEPIGRPGMPLTEWIDEVLTYRQREAEQAEQESLARRGDAVEYGLRESLLAGVTAIGEIATADPVLPADRERPGRYCVFRELIGWTTERIAQQRDIARLHVRQLHACGDGIRAGLNPHAPYTASPELIQWVCRLSRRARLPVAMHLAESEEELRFLQTGHGPLRELLCRHGAWVDAASRLNARPRDYLAILAQAHRAIVVHGNYLGPEDWRYLADCARGMTTVYCPRTHDYFGHAPYPLAAMLASGVRVAIGTDSRASNPDLDVLRELRFAARHHPEVRPERIWEMGTLAGAAALGWADQAGSLEPGKRADLTILPIDPDDLSDPCGALLHSNRPIRATVCGGQFVGDANHDELLRGGSCSSATSANKPRS